MSHVTNINMKIKDLDAMAEGAAPEWGLEFLRDQKKFMTYGGVQNACDHAMRLKDHQRGDFELGLVKNGDEYELKGDLWGQTRLLEAVGGPQFNKLKREYTVAVSMRNAPRGFIASRQALPNNRVRLALRKR